jgi:hypothetical protein
LPQYYELAENKGAEFNYDILQWSELYEAFKKTNVLERSKYIEIKHYILCNEIQKR